MSDTVTRLPVADSAGTPFTSLGVQPALAKDMTTFGSREIAIITNKPETIPND